MNRFRSCTTRKARWRALVCACAAALWPQSALAGPDSPPDDDASAESIAQQARDLFEEGNDLFREGKFADARAAYLAAFSIRPHWQIAMNLGAAELQLGRYLDAAERLSFARRHPDLPGEEVAAVDALLSKATAHLATVTFVSNVDGADITVDGQRAGSTPLAAPVFMKPGKHNVVAARHGYQDAHRLVEALAGAELTVELQLEKETGVPAAPPPPTGQADVDDDMGGLPLWPAFMLGGGALAGVGLGVVGFVTSSSARSDADALAARGADCDAACFSQLEDELGTESIFEGVGIGGLVTGAALAVGTAVYLVVYSGSSKRDAGDAGRTTWLVPVVAGRPGLTVGTTF